MSRPRSHPLSLLLLLLTFTLLTTATPAPTKKKDCYKTVTKGKKIQDALNAAKSGDTITVEAGTYTEYLTISKSHITLIGKPGAILVSPTKPPKKPNPCSGLAQVNGTDVEAGICIHGKNVKLEAYNPALQHRKFISAEKSIQNVVVSGFTVKNFLGENIAVLAGEKTRIKSNTLIDGNQYGFLSVGSTGTRAEHNKITSSSLLFIAMCMDDRASAEFQNNNISNYFIALCTETNRGLVKKNTVTDCCIGPFIDPGIVGARIFENTITGRNAFCPSGVNGTGSGIVIFGAKDTQIKQNTITGIKNEGFGVGIFISDDPVTGAPATGNVIKENKFSDNDLDIFSVATGTNTIQANSCGSASGPEQGDICQ
jgi:nitrous oxidase accessory protein NosD